MIDKFMEFVNEQKSKAEEGIDNEKTVEQEKLRWLHQLEVLGKFITSALVAYENAGIQTTKKMVVVTEEQTGPYEAPQFEISVGPAIVKLRPIGTYLIGAFGRVDMEGPRGITRLILVPKKATAPRIEFRTTTIPAEKTEPELVWKIMPPPPDMTYIELTNDVFLEMLMKVVRGG